MSQDQPKLYLISPPVFALDQFSETLRRVLGDHDVACLRLALAQTDEDEVRRAADVCRDIAHGEDVAIVLEDHVKLIDSLGLDGVHLKDGSRGVRDARKELGIDAIVGAFCGASKHDGMNAAEAGADYVSFGPVTQSNLGTATPADGDLFAWWFEMIEVPLVAEGGFDVETARAVAAHMDFIALGGEVWGSDDPSLSVSKFMDAVS